MVKERYLLCTLLQYNTQINWMNMGKPPNSVNNGLTSQDEEATLARVDPVLEHPLNKLLQVSDPGLGSLTDRHSSRNVYVL